MDAALIDSYQDGTAIIQNWHVQGDGLVKKLFVTHSILIHNHLDACNWNMMAFYLHRAGQLCSVEHYGAPFFLGEAGEYGPLWP